MRKCIIKEIILLTGAVLFTTQMAIAEQVVSPIETASKEENGASKEKETAYKPIAIGPTVPLPSSLSSSSKLDTRRFEGQRFIMTLPKRMRAGK